ncbi:MAG TPA: carboxypeptidase regulatory-like domain-containing protein [Candidatus Angelobacter sp.]|nr:carboxypeptidase regulatory-like domain-containing protein [Candidatus Angelobacter sp.]
MSFRSVRMTATFFLWVLLFCFCDARLLAQAPTGGLTGLVTDPSGAVVGKAAVRVTDAGGASFDTTSNKEGIYEFKGLVPGTYSLKAVAKGFALFTQDEVQIVAGQVKQVNIGLLIQIEEQKVEVTDQSTKVDLDPSSNAGMVVMKGKDLEALSDDPDELQSELQALAGPSAGPNGGQIYIDGFTAGQLPPKASIREIRINQNPFSSEYDKLGYGRVEILTKPGTDQLHGQLSVTGNTAAFNSRNPFEGTAQAPSYYSTQYSANLGGSLGKKASFFFNIERRNLNELAVVNTPLVDPTSLQITQFSGAFPNPRARTNVSQRFDYQVTPNNTLTARYQYWRNSESGDGVGGFSLPSVGYNSLETEHTFQMTDTQVVSARTINETRFQFVREGNNQNPRGTAPTISIQGAFTGGSSSGGTYNDTQNRYELQNITYMTLGKHTIKYGGRFRSTTDDNSSDAKFNGVYSFGSRANPGQTASCAMLSPAPTGQLTGIQAYQITVNCLAQNVAMVTIIANGGGASYYSLNSNATGIAAANVSWLDGAIFVQDDWRVRPNVTVSGGLRYETQNNLGDHADFAPRVGVAWALDGAKNKSPKTVLRAGFGIFYDRFTSDLVLQQQLQNGVVQQQFLVQDPTFFNPTTTTPLQGAGAPSQVVYQVNPALRTPYTMQVGATIERQLGKYANLSVTYLKSHGVHQFYTNFVNASQPGTPPPSQFTYEFESGGIFKQNQLIVNSSVRMGAKVSLFGYYTLNYANSDTSGAGTLASDPFDILVDYGRASFDVRHRVFFGGSVGLPWAVRLSPFMIASSGAPFNIVTGQAPGLFGNAAFNTRPTVGTCGSPGVMQTTYGCFNLVTLPNQTVIPINDATGPGRFTLNLRVSKTFGFGQKKEAAGGGGPGGPTGGTFGRGPGGGGPHGGGGGGGERGGGMFGGNPSNYRYNLTFSVNARNIFNNVNVANPIGNLSSPLFGEANALAGGPFSSATANRRIDLQLMFNF